MGQNEEKNEVTLQIAYPIATLSLADTYRDNRYTALDVIVYDNGTVAIDVPKAVFDVEGPSGEATVLFEVRTKLVEYQKQLAEKIKVSREAVTAEEQVMSCVVGLIRSIKKTDKS